MTLSDASSDAIEKQAKPLRQLLRLCLALSAIAFLVIAGPRIWNSLNPVTSPPIPHVDLKNSSQRVQEVIAQAQQAVRDNPQNGSVWGELGMVLIAYQFDLESQICFEQASELDEKEVRWPYLHGLAVMAFDRQEAVRSFRHALERDDRSGVIHNRLGELLLELGRLDEAEQSLVSAQKLQPEEIRPYIALARLEIARERFDEALVWASKANDLDPDRRLIHELLANIHNRLGDRDTALSELEFAASLPDQPLLWNDPFAAAAHQFREDSNQQFDTARTLLEQNRIPDAISLMQSALQNDDRDPQNYCRLAQTLMELNRMQEAADVLERGQFRHPDSVKIRFQRGVYMFRTEDYPSAAKLFREVVDVKPDYTDAQINLGYTLERLNDQLGALAAFESASRTRPTDATAHREAGRVLLELGRPGDAQTHLELAVRFNKKDEQAVSLLDRARAAVQPEAPK